MRLFTLCFLFLLAEMVQAQTFYAHQPAETFRGLDYSSIAFADIDGDGDEDMFVTGGWVRGLSARDPQTTLFLNHENQFYKQAPSELGTFTPIMDGDVAFADLDGDGDMDLITGGNTRGFGSIPVGMLYTYLNDGTGAFTARDTISSTWNTSISVGDVDGDNDNDVLVTGNRGSSNSLITYLYLNNGNARLTTTTTTLRNYTRASTDFGDIDGDGDLDMVAGGLSAGSSYLTTLYRNDGTGTFTQISGLNGCVDGDVKFVDLDGDGDQDLVTVGLPNAAGPAVATVYQNPGNGVFVNLGNQGLAGVSNADLDFADLDADGDMDAVIVGDAGSSVYYNDGTGTFTAATGIALENANFGSADFADIDGDGDQDLCVQGLNPGPNQNEHNIYLNDGNGVLTKQYRSPYLATGRGPINVVDMEGDGDLDVFISNSGVGQFNYFIPIVYTNPGNNRLQRASDASTGLDQATFSAGFAGDVDGDGDQDLIITGVDGFNGRETKLYINDGSNGFTVATGTAFPNIDNAIGAFGDVDGDGDLDFALSGVIPNVNTEICQLYYNNGSGNFTLASNAQVPFPAISAASIVFSDVDGDGDQDCLLSGVNNTNPPTVAGTFLFRNSGTGTFTQDASATFDGIVGFSIATADVDSDGDQDAFVSGGLMGPMGFSILGKLFLNDGTGAFTSTTGTFNGTVVGSATFGDLDGDSDPDLLLTGATSFPNANATSSLYLNTGAGNFMAAPSPIDTFYDSYVTIADLDGDGDNDILVAGNNGNGNMASAEYSTYYYENTLITVSAQVLPTPAEAPESRIFPNPNHTGWLHLNYDAPRALDLQVQLVDLSGKLIDRRVLSLTSGMNTLQFDIQNLPSGAYIVHLNDGTNNSAHQLLVP